MWTKDSSIKQTKGGFEHLVRELSIPIYGVLGAIRFLTGWFIIVVLDRQLVGRIEDKEVFLVTKTAVYPIPRCLYTNDEEVLTLSSLFSLLSFLFSLLSNSSLKLFSLLSNSSLGISERRMLILLTHSIRRILKTDED